MTLKHAAEQIERIGAIAADQPLTSVVAGASVISPVWLPGLSDISSISALLLPILGVIWLIVQTLRAICFWGRGR